MATLPIIQISIPNCARILYLVGGSRAAKFAGFERCADVLDDAVAYFHLPLGGDNVLDLPTTGLSQNAVCGLQLMDDLCTTLGFMPGEITNIGDEIADFWKDVYAQYEGEPVSGDWNEWNAVVPQVAAADDSDESDDDNDDDEEEGGDGSGLHSGFDPKDYNEYGESYNSNSGFESLDDG
ncbi:hypothetical protein EK21DRAFT_84104 [Setomelanomma holmii]|uniref:Uncharacterized protein n=1 Tax=Setomelanomma holmii TaxID=210430 RepID=A0A9P4HMG9_9PLEO|nr:hypothetical protein EK21DRAFT_84104 [Setomelanomma holmii]